MLKEILDSKNDSSALALFLTSSPRAYSIPELSRRLGLKPQKTAFSLNTLANHGLLKTFARRGKKYYLLNQKFSLLKEIKNNVKGLPKLEDELFSSIKKLGTVKAAFLSGLFTGQPSLPVDLLLVGKVSLSKMEAFLKSVSKMMGQEINYSIMSEDEFVLRRDTFDKFIKDIFDYPHITVCDKLK